MGNLAGIAVKIEQDSHGLYELCGQMIATMEVNLDRGYLVSRDDDDFRRIIASFKGRLSDLNPARIELQPKAMPGCYCPTCKAILSRPTGAQVEENKPSAATGELPSVEPNRH